MKEITTQTHTSTDGTGLNMEFKDQRKIRGTKSILPSYLDWPTTGVNFINALADNVWHKGCCLREVLAQINTKRCHLAWEPFVPALNGQSLQTLLVACQSTLQTNCNYAYGILYLECLGINVST